MKLIGSRTFLLVLCAAIVAFVFNLFLGDRLAAHFATWSVAKKYHLVEPRAPLVINTREEVRVNEANDLVAVINKSKGKVVAVVDMGLGAPALRGAATALSADGLFVTSKLSLEGVKQDSLVLVSGDGRAHKVTKIVFDGATNIALLKTDITGLSVASFAKREDVLPAERVMLLGSTTNGNPYFLASFISSGESLSAGAWSSELPSHSLPMQAVSGSVPGQGVFMLSGELAGMWDGNSVVPASVIAEAVGSYLSSGGVIARPYFGFAYTYIPASFATNGSQTAGFLVTKLINKTAPTTNSPAAVAGLVVGDIIRKVAGQDVASSPTPDILLTGASVNKSISFEIVRNGKSLVINITPIQQ